MGSEDRLTAENLERGTGMGQRSENGPSTRLFDFDGMYDHPQNRLRLRDLVIGDRLEVKDWDEKERIYEVMEVESGCIVTKRVGGPPSSGEEETHGEVVEGCVQCGSHRKPGEEDEYGPCLECLDCGFSISYGDRKELDWGKIYGIWNQLGKMKGLWDRETEGK